MRATLVVTTRGLDFATCSGSSADVPVAMECEGECSLSQNETTTKETRKGIGKTSKYRAMQRYEHTEADNVKASRVNKAGKRRKAWKGGSMPVFKSMEGLSCRSTLADCQCGVAPRG